MCLDYVTKIKESVPKNRGVIAYKLFRKDMSGWSKHIGTKGLKYKIGKTYAAQEETIISKNNRLKNVTYTSGFHAFLSYLAPKTISCLMTEPELEIHRILLWGNITYGEQFQEKSVSGQYMEILD